MRSFVSVFCILVMGLAGCSKGGRVEDFKPDADRSRKALEAALTHWKEGQKSGTIPGTPPIEAVDAKWKAGQKLLEFEILGEEPQSGAGPRVFKVRLTLAKGSPQEVRYFVFGIEPLSVYRDEDYKQLEAMGK